MITNFLSETSLVIELKMAKQQLEAASSCVDDLQDDVFKLREALSSLVSTSYRYYADSKKYCAVCAAPGYEDHVDNCPVKKAEMILAMVRPRVAP